MHKKHMTYWQVIWKQFCQHRLGLAAFFIVLLFCLVGIYAPFLASSKPLMVKFQGHWYFPLFRYLFYQGFFTKRLDLFYNLLIFTFPLFVLGWFIGRRYSNYFFSALLSVVVLHFSLFIYLAYREPRDPSASPQLNQARQKQVQQQLKVNQVNSLLTPPFLPSWERDLSYLTPYAQLNLVLRYQQRQAQYRHLQIYEKDYLADAKQKGKTTSFFPTLWQTDLQHDEEEIARQQQIVDDTQKAYPEAKSLVNLLLKTCQPSSLASTFPPWLTCDFLVKLNHQDTESFIHAKQIVETYEKAQAQLAYIKDKRKWLEEQTAQLSYEVMPLLRSFHWEDDAGGGQELNRYISWWKT